MGDKIVGATEVIEKMSERIEPRNATDSEQSYVQESPGLYQSPSPQPYQGPE
jgi:hypothetical protein